MRHTRTLAAICAVTLVTALVSGCACSASPTDSSPSVQPVPTETVEPTTPVRPGGPTTSTGPITTPGSGTASRAAILKAVSKGLGVSGTLTVNQLYVQGTAAVGDVKTPAGSRVFFAVTGGSGAWKLQWSAPFGSSLASVAELLQAAPEVSPELVAKLDFTKVVKPAKAPTLSSFKSFVLDSAKTMAAGSYDGTFTVSGKIAADEIGEYWGAGLAEPDDTTYESIGIWGHYANGKWTGEVASFGDPGAPAAYFPPEALSALGS